MRTVVWDVGLRMAGRRRRRDGLAVKGTFEVPPEDEEEGAEEDEVEVEVEVEELVTSNGDRSARSRRLESSLEFRGGRAQLGRGGYRGRTRGCL
jgi:hypothetical protein